MRKEALVLIAVAITVLSTIWTVTYFSLGRPLPALAPLAYQLISIVSLAHFSRTGDFNLLRLVHIGAMLVLPFALQWSLGGFDNSSAMMVWAFAAPLSALIFYGPRRAIAFFLVYMALAIFSGAIDPLLPASEPMPPALRLAFYVLNIGGVSIVTYAVLQYFVHALVAEQGRSDALLRNVLPEAIAERLKSGQQLIANDHPSVTVLFADLVEFTPLARREQAASVIAILDDLFTRFDALAEKHGLEKIKTMGDAYMAVAGAPEPRPDHACAAARMALDLIDEVAAIRAETGREMDLRVGLHSGHAIAGVIGRRKFAYDLWGDAVNVASRMESQGVPGKIHVSEAVARQLDGEFRLVARGTIEVKGLGEMRTYFLERE